MILCCPHNRTWNNNFGFFWKLIIRCKNKVKDRFTNTNGEKCRFSLIMEQGIYFSLVFLCFMFVCFCLFSFIYSVIYLFTFLCIQYRDSAWRHVARWRRALSLKSARGSILKIWDNRLSQSRWYYFSGAAGALRGSPNLLHHGHFG